MLPLLVPLLLLLSLSPLGSSSESNLKTRLKKDAFYFLANSAQRIIDEQVPNIEIPTIDVDIEGGTLRIQDIKIKKFNSPDFDLSFTPSGLHWDSTDGGVKVRANVYIRYGFVSQRGWIVATAVDLRMFISAAATTLEGRPQLSISDCQMKMMAFDLQLGGDWVMWIVNIFRPMISAQVQQMINQQACSYARDLVLDQGNTFLLSLPVDVDIGKGFWLHYHIDEDPAFTVDHADMQTTVTVTYGDKSTCAPLETPLDETDPFPSMGSVWLSEQVPNCLLQTAFQERNFSVTATHINVPSIESYLKTSCWLSCIGFFFPSLKKDHPDQHVSLTLSPASPPIVSFLDGSTSINASIYMDFHIYPKEENPQSLLRLNLASIGEVSPYLEDRKLKGKIDSISINATEVFSTIGDVSETFLTGFDAIFKPISTSLLTVLLSKGIPIPIYDDLSISDNSIILERPGQVLLSLNFTDTH